MENNEQEGRIHSLESFLAQKLEVEIVDRISEEDLQQESILLNRFYSNWGSPEKIMKYGDGGTLQLLVCRVIFKDKRGILSEDLLHRIEEFYEKIGITLDAEENTERVATFISSQHKSADNKCFLFIGVSDISPFFFVTITELHSPFLPFPMENLVHS